MTVAIVGTPDWEIETGVAYTAETTGDDLAIIACAVWGDNTGGGTISDHSHGTEDFVNDFIENDIGANSIYSSASAIVEADIISGSQTYTAELSIGTPSIGHSSVIMTCSGVDQTSPIAGHSLGVQSPPNANFSTMTFSAVAGDMVFLVVAASVAIGDVSPPGDNGGDSWVQEQEPWTIGGLFVDGAVFSLTATETHSGASAQAGNDAGSFISTSSIFTVTADTGGQSIVPLVIQQYINRN